MKFQNIFTLLGYIIAILLLSALVIYLANPIWFETALAQLLQLSPPTNGNTNNLQTLPLNTDNMDAVIATQIENFESLQNRINDQNLVIRNSVYLITIAAFVFGFFGFKSIKDVSERAIEIADREFNKKFDDATKTGGSLSDILAQYVNAKEKIDEQLGELSHYESLLTLAENGVKYDPWANYYELARQISKRREKYLENRNAGGIHPTSETIEDPKFRQKAAAVLGTLYENAEKEIQRYLALPTRQRADSFSYPIHKIAFTMPRVMRLACNLAILQLVFQHLRLSSREKIILYMFLD